MASVSTYVEYGTATAYFLCPNCRHPWNRKRNYERRFEWSSFHNRPTDGTYRYEGVGKWTDEVHGECCPSCMMLSQPSHVEHEAEETPEIERKAPPPITWTVVERQDLSEGAFFERLEPSSGPHVWHVHFANGTVVELGLGWDSDEAEGRVLDAAPEECKP